MKKPADFALSVDEKHLENGAYQKRWGGGGGRESHEYRDFFLKQKFKLNEVIAAFLNFSGLCRRYLSAQSDKFNFHLNNTAHTKYDNFVNEQRAISVGCWLATDLHINNDDSLKL